jgi:hypothetical protein
MAYSPTMKVVMSSCEVVTQKEGRIWEETKEL